MRCRGLVLSRRRTYTVVRLLLQLTARWSIAWHTIAFLPQPLAVIKSPSDFGRKDRMNEIIIRTNRSEYVAGSVIYGAVYLRVFTPITADSLIICLSGEESCNWKIPLPNVGPAPIDGDEPEPQMREIKFEGKKNILVSEYTLTTFADGTVPLGCYAYPFQFTLRQGIPNSFQIKAALDEIKKSAYEAGVSYKITAKLQCSSSSMQSKLGSSKAFSLRNEDMLFIDKGRCQKNCKAVVKNCFCFPKGELSLKVELDKAIYTIGETVIVKFWVENKSDVKLEFAKIKLIRTINVAGRLAGSEEEKLDIQEAFPSEIFNIKKELEMNIFKKKYFEIILPLNCSDEDTLSSTLGSIVKCRHHLEVEIVVPWDEDISVLMPIEVFPGPLESWLAWKPEEWIKNSMVVNTNSVCKVSRHILESSEFANVPLPLRGLDSN